jgi:ribosomal protein S18 acetylase RimI-like enzyme
LARPGSCEIRAGGPADTAAVTALWTEAYSGRGEGEGRREPYRESEFFDALRGGELAVAEAAGAVAGVVVLYPPGAAGRVTARGEEAELSRLAVAGTARGQGIGWALVERCALRARALGAPAIVLWSRPYQVAAHRLYEAQGYRRAPERDGRDGDGERWTFSLDLALAPG